MQLSQQPTGHPSAAVADCLSCTSGLRLKLELEMKLRNMKRNRNRTIHLTALGACLGAAITGSVAWPARADSAADAGRLAKVEQENKDLKQRLDALEGLAQKEGLLTSGQPAPKFAKALSNLSISGFVQASYFYNTARPADGKSAAYLWNTTDNSFSINKVKLTLASPPVERSGDKFDAGFRVSMIWGEDAPVLNTGSPGAGFEPLREAYVDLNVPLGTGLNVKAGQLISLLNYESGDGGAANANFSQGNQWFFTGNGPAAGVQLGYTITDWLDVTARVQNGLYGGPVDMNSAKTFLGSLGFKPDSKTWINLIGFAGDGTPVSKSVQGGSVLAGRQWTPQFNTGLEFDYFNFGPAGGGPGKDLWSIGGWVGYDFTPKVGLAFRGEYLNDVDGYGIKGVGFPGRAGSAIVSPNANGDLYGLTLTLNLRVTSNLKLQPEVRYDRTSYTGGLDGKNDRFIVGLGATYLF